ncbi:hypothetical protein [Winogradskyella vidalii]|uniref:hypothetical protein n=1 Tax=Winogradskyella vidalii TaxID=2615024 RepID=UPI0015C7538E|nr:hypothetical protein [Winogradskyella vidalii]
MGINKNIVRVLFISFVFLITACSSDDDNPNDDDNGGVVGADHTYDIELVGDSETINVSGSISNPVQDNEENNYGVVSVYAINPEAGEDSIMISMSIGTGNALQSIFGVFMLDENRQALYPFANPDDYDDNETGLAIRPEGSNTIYESISGTLNFSNVELASTSAVSGVASFTLNFSGVFIDDEENTFQGSGTIVINPLLGLTYN